MVVGRTLAVGALASRALVIGTVLAAEIVARGPVVVQVVEAFAPRGRSWGLGIAEVGVTVYVGRKREPHHRDRKQS